MNSKARVTLGTAACVALILWPAGFARAADVAPVPSAGCELARIDGVAVTSADADALRALLQPPPSAASSRRLAVDAALAWWDVHGWLAGSSSRARLDAWRAWLAVGTSPDAEALDVRRAAADIAHVAARAGMVRGVCGDALATSPAADRGTARASDRAPRAAQVLERSNSAREVYSARILRVDSADATPTLGPSVEAIAAELREGGQQPEVHDVVLPLRQLETPLALALAVLAKGATEGPVRTPSGLYWLERR